MWLLLVLALVIRASDARAAAFPPGFTTAPIATGLVETIASAFSPDGRLFICEKPGRLRVIKNGALLAEPFLTLDVETAGSDGSNGLLGVVFDPQVGSNGYFYVHYTVKATPTGPAHNRISRFEAAGDIANPASEHVVLELHDISVTGHYGGDMHFGPDGKLYIAIGQYDSPGSAQLLTDFKGKILRINPDGTIPADNPFSQQAQGVYRAIWALGLRNPFTFAFDPSSGRMFINDIGEQTYEEINDGLSGANYGWPDAEGPGSNPLHRDPLYFYGREEGCALTAGTFYNPPVRPYPAVYAGKYFFADWCEGWIKTLDPAAPVSARPFGTGTSRPMDLEVGPDGRIYYIEWHGTNVFRIQFTAAVDVTANGQDGPLTLEPGDPLQVALAFDVGQGVMNPAEMYIGLFTPFGLFWLGPAGFSLLPLRLYAGPLPAFGPARLFNIPNVSALWPGVYWWFVVVDDDSNGVVNGDFVDAVQTTIAS